MAQKKYEFASHLIIKHDLELSPSFLEDLSTKLIRNRNFKTLIELLHGQDDLKLKLIEAETQDNSKKTALTLIKEFGYNINDKEFEGMRIKLRESAFRYFVGRNDQKK